MYTILADKTTADSDDAYQGIPPLKIILSGTPCAIAP